VLGRGQSCIPARRHLEQANICCNAASKTVPGDLNLGRPGLSLSQTICSDNHHQFAAGVGRREKCIYYKFILMDK
jgi:hypothetical protein